METLKFGFILMLFFLVTAKAQETIYLYPHDIPNSKNSGIKETGIDTSSGLFRVVTNPTLEVYLPKKENASGAAVVICPGGSYKVIVYMAEGVKTAKEFAKKRSCSFCT